MERNEVVAVGVARTAIGDFGGSLSSLTAVELGTIASRAALERGGVKPEQVEHVITGLVLKGGCKPNPARQIQLALKIPVEAGAITIDQQCASGLRALEIASHQIMLGVHDCVLVCGAESMSNVPYSLPALRSGARMGNTTAQDSLLHDGLVDPFINAHMGVTAENLAAEYAISREAQDELAVLSHQRATSAIREGKFKKEITPVEITTRKGVTVVDQDEHPRETTMENLKKLRPAFQKEGTVTAGNSSALSDGAAAIVLMSRKKADELGLAPLFQILSTVTVGVPPEVMGIGPVYEIPKAVALAGLTMAEIDYYEINEAFAAQFLAVNKQLNLPMEKVNANGSGISLGHPVGSTGIRILISGYYELLRRSKQYGCVSLCAGGGPGMALVFQVIQ